MFQKTYADMNIKTDFQYEFIFDVHDIFLHSEVESKNYKKHLMIIILSSEICVHYVRANSKYRG